MTNSSSPRWFRPSEVTNLSAQRLRLAKPGFSTRRVPFHDPRYDWSKATLLSGPMRPRSGDIVLAEVERPGHHRRIELPTGRKPTLAPGMEIIVAYGDRYAPDQFEAEIPDNLGPTNLAAAGGVAATVISRHSSTRKPTDLRPIGLIGDAEGNPLNLSQFALPNRPVERTRPPVIAVLGTSMNAGKTTAVASLITGLTEAGHQAGGTKVTGTGSGGDFWSMTDAGAAAVVDFTDAGYASTYKLSLETVERIMTHLVNHLANIGASAIVVEVADGIFQLETAALVRSPVFRGLVDGVVFAAGDAVGAVGGAEMLRQMDVPLLAVTGAFTASPLAVREVAAQSSVPVFTKPDLCSADPAQRLISWASTMAARRNEVAALGTTTEPIPV